MPTGSNTGVVAPERIESCVEVETGKTFGPIVIRPFASKDRSVDVAVAVEEAMAKSVVSAEPFVAITENVA